MNSFLVARQDNPFGWQFNNTISLDSNNAPNVFVVAWEWAGTFIHEVFHAAQYSDNFGHQGIADTIWFLETSAVWYPGTIGLGTGTVMSGTVGTNPQFSLWATYNNGIAGEPGASFRTQRTYGLGQFVAYLSNVKGVSPGLVSRFYATDAPITPQEYLYNQIGPANFRQYFTEWTAMDAAHQDYLSRGEWAAANNWTNTYGNTADINRYIQTYTNSGTGGAWVSPPSNLAPRGWGANVFRVINSSAATYTLQLNGNATGSEGTASVFTGTAVVMNPAGNQYYPFTMSNSTQGTVTLNVPASATELFFVIDAVPAHFNGNQIYSYQVKIDRNVPIPLITAGSTWKFFDTGAAPASWMQNDFNDAAWPSGPAMLGYGDLNGQTPTTLVNNTPSRITTYFRHTFNVANPRQFADLALRILRDDGAVLWLNGVEVHRSNMPAEPAAIDANTQAFATTTNADENTYFTATLDARELRVGTNVIAVEVHQSGTASSDLGFDLSLDGVFDIPEPLIAAGSTWKYRDTGIAPSSANWTTNAYTDTAWGTGPARLGYGDTQATTVSHGTDVNNRHITTWFRHAFTVADATLFDALRLELQRDDGAVVYLNGVELLRDNLPSSAITPTQLATTAIGAADETAWNIFTIPATALLNGANMLAVELHQAAANSSDLGFDFRLFGIRQSASTFANWQAARFGSDNTNAALAGPLTDLDKDGLNTLLEYAFASDPRRANQDAAPTATTASGRLALQFERNPAATDVTIKVQAADTLTGPWTDLATSSSGNPFATTTPGTTIIENTIGPLRSVEVRDLFPLNEPLHPRRFMRVHVTQQ